MSERDMGTSVFRAVADFSKVRREARETGRSMDELDRKTQAVGKNGVGAGGEGASAKNGEKQGKAFRDGAEKGANSRKPIKIKGALITSGVLLGIPALGSSAAALLSLAHSLLPLAALAVPATAALGGLALAGLAVGLAMKDAKAHLGDLAPAFKAVQQSVSSNFWYFAEKPIRFMVSKLLPDFKDKLEDIGSAMGRNVGRFSEDMADAFGNGRLARQMENVRIAADNMQGAFAATPHILATIGDVGSKFLPRLGNFVSDIALRFNNWLDKVAASGQLEAWVNNGIAVLKDLGRITGSVLDIVNTLMSAGSLASGFGVGGLADALGKIDAWLKKPEIKAGLVRFFENSGKAMDGLMKGLGPLGEALFQILDALGPVLAVLGEQLGRVLAALAPVLVELVKQLAPALIRLLPHVADLIIALLPIIEAVIPLIGPLLDALIPIIQLVADLAKLLAPVIKLIADFLKPLLEINAAWIQTIVDGLEMLFKGDWKGLDAVMKKFLDKLGEMGGPVVKDAIKFLMDFLSGKWLAGVGKWWESLFDNAFWKSTPFGFLTTFSQPIKDFVSGKWLGEFGKWWETLFNGAFWVTLGDQITPWARPIIDFVKGDWIAGAAQWWVDLFSNAFFMPGSETRKALDDFIAVAKSLFDGSAFGSGLKGVGDFLGNLFGGGGPQSGQGQTSGPGHKLTGAGLDAQGQPQAAGGGIDASGAIAGAQKVQETLKGIGDAIVAVWQFAMTSVVQAGADIVNSVTSVVNGVSATWQNGWANITSVLQFAVSSWTSIVQFGVTFLETVIVGAIVVISTAWFNGWMMAAQAVQVSFGVIVPTVAGGMAAVTASVAFGMLMAGAAWLTGWLTMLAVESGIWPVIIGVTIAGWAGVIAAFYGGVAGSLAAAATLIPGLVFILGGAAAVAGVMGVGIGIAIMGGIIGGIASMIPALVGELAIVTALIPKNKGPMEKDRKLLTPAGQAVMGGLIDGVSSMRPALVKELRGVTTDVSGGFSMQGALSASAVPSKGAFAPAVASTDGARNAPVNAVTDKGLTVIVQNPVPEKASTSIQRTYQKIGYLGLDGKENAGV